MAFKLKKELERLAEAERRILAAEMAVSRQKTKVERLRKGGNNAALAMRTLGSFERILERNHHHRTELIRTIEQIDPRWVRHRPGIPLSPDAAN